MKSSLLLLPLVTAGIALAGCEAQEDVSTGAIIHDLSPELQGSVERPIDAERHINITQDFNTRLFWDDLGRMFYTDKPSRLTPLPMPNSNTNPQ